MNSIQRHLAKTVTYRILATTITITSALLLGVSIEISTLLGVTELLVKPVFYFFHERVWYKIRFKKD